MHLKRIAAPRNWIINKKERKFIARPMPGPHGINNCITINMLIKEFLKQANTTKEVQFILNNGKILINKVQRKDYRFPIGIMDIIEIPELKQKYILLYNRNGKFILSPVKDSSVKLCKIIGKKVLKNKKIQINLHDGRNFLLDKNNYSVGDTIVLDLENKKVKDHLKLEKDSFIYLTEGSYKGSIGKLNKILDKEGCEEQKITFTLDNKVHSTLKKCAFVIGKDKPLIEVNNE